MSRRIFLSGVHGVGKGYFIKNKLEGITDLSVISASKIISQFRDSEDAGNKRVRDVEGNQRILLDGLKDYFINRSENILLDGHIVILDSEDCINRIPLSFFEKGMFDTLILLQDEPNCIYDRMFKRDGVHKISIELIAKIQEQESLYAEELKKEELMFVISRPFPKSHVT